MIVIVTVNYGNPKDTVELFNSILSSTEIVDVHIIVVDNGSIYKHKQDLAIGLGLREHYNFPTSIVKGRDATIIYNEENLGFSGGNNVGIRFAVEKLDAKYVWLLNNDTTLDINAIKNMKLCLDRNRDSIVGSTLAYYHDRTVQCLGGAKLNKLTHTGRFIKSGLELEEVQGVSIEEVQADIDYIHGASMLIPRKIIDTIGNLDERYFLYYEEVDYCFAALEAGFDLRWAKDVIVFHKEGRSINEGLYRDSRSELSEYHATRSFCLFILKWHPDEFLKAILIRLTAKLVINALKRRWNLLQSNFKATKSVVRQGK